MSEKQHKQNSKQQTVECPTIPPSLQNRINSQCMMPHFNPFLFTELCTYRVWLSLVARVVATVGGAGRGRPALTISARHNQKKKRFPPGTKKNFLVPGTMFHNRGSIIAQYTYVIYIENDLVRLWIPARALPLDPRSLALRFIGFTHSACHYYSQLFSTTQIGLATTLLVAVSESFVSMFKNIQFSQFKCSNVLDMISVCFVCFKQHS